MTNDQQFCLKWNNFQANITSQFETLRDEEYFTDVTIACEGQRIQAHKVVLSACSPFFKELFKNNPCSHPIIFMRDVEAHHVVSLLEFMYAGQVNVAQAHLSTFLKTAESLKIRGLTDTSENSLIQERDGWDSNQSKQISINLEKSKITSTSNVSSSQDVNNPQIVSSPPPKKNKTETDMSNQQNDNRSVSESDMQKSIEVPNRLWQPKDELPDYVSDIEEDDREDNELFTKFPVGAEVPKLSGNMDILPRQLQYHPKEIKQESFTQGKDSRKLHSLDPRPCEECGKVYSNLSNLRQHMRLIHYPTYVQCNLCHKPFKTDLYLRRHIVSSHGTAFMKNDKTFNTKLFDVNLARSRSSDFYSSSVANYGCGFVTDSSEITSLFGSQHDEKRSNRLIKLAEGIEVYEDQLRSVKWSDYRKLTRGLATILFSPTELATCSVTGQRWSRAGSGERPVKPALDKVKVQAIISYVATRFPMVEVSRIKQVLAYKCKENSTALKMKAVRYYSNPVSQ